MSPSHDDRVQTLYREAVSAVHRRADLLFGALFVLQFVAVVIAAAVLTPKTWAGEQSSTHIHVWAGLILGGLLAAMPLGLIAFRRGEAVTRYVVAASQMMFSALLIHMSGGRIETHFHVFGSLAFLAYYRDWRVLVCATAVISVDHVLRGIFWPESVFGVLVSSPWRAMEHAGWVLFEAVVLVFTCLQNRKEMLASAELVAEREMAHHRTEQLVAERTQELQLKTAALADSEQRLRLAIRGSQDGLWDWNLVTNKVYYAPRWKELLGYEDHEIGDSPEELFTRVVSGDLAHLQDAMAELVSGDAQDLDVEIEVIRADGSHAWLLCRATTQTNEAGEPVRLAGSISDISEVKRAQERLRQLANHDRLTGLPNRDLFMDRLNRLINRARHDRGYTFAVLFGDFDRFKIINDSLGHSVGDAMLVQVAGTLRDIVRESDTVARFGGDEFAILLDSPYSEEDALATAGRLVREFNKPLIVRGHELSSSLSLGLVMHNEQYDSAEAMLRDADAAMYQAKLNGKNRCQVFDEAMHKAALDRLNTEQDMLSAVRDEAVMNAQFHMHYQPIVDLSTRDIVGFEALLRWQHPENGMIRPDRFIEIAEENGAIVAIGQWTLRKACEQCVAWRRLVGPDRPLVVNVNLSRRQIVQPDLLPMLERVLADTGARPQDIKLELTETAIMDERLDVVSIMHDIRSLGFSIAMDDFGTGQSSLGSLRNYPIQTLKIDRAFLRGMTEHREFTAVMNAIVSLAGHLNLDVVAEGIENEAQLVQLQAMDCPYAQGYLFGRPVDMVAATELLRDGLPRLGLAG